MFKKIIAYTLITVLLLSATFMFPVTAAQSTSTWKDSLSKLELLGVISETDLNMSGNMSREVFAKIIVNSTGNYELAQSLSGATSFSDVNKSSAYCGFINAAVNKGYLSALANGQFKPKEALNFAALCTAMVKALGYSGSDIIGTWPTGYIEKAKSLGMTTGFSLKSNDKVLTSAAVTMIYRMLNTNIKKANAAEADKTLLDSTGLLDDQENLVYGKPEVAYSFNPLSKKLGDITFKSGVSFLRNTVNNTVTPSTTLVGEVITINDIKNNDVVYEVYNKMNVLMYYLVVDNVINGTITSILPNKYSPTSIQVNDVNYELGEYADLSKFDLSSGSFNVGDDITLVIGYDGKVVDAYHMQYDDNGDYAFVVNTSTTISTAADDYGKVYYTVELLLVDGSKKTYKIKEYPNQYKWKLVEYAIESEDTVSLNNVTYMADSKVEINNYEKKVGQSYVSDNIKIFNYTDSNVSLIKLSDLANGTLPAGKVKYIGTTGDFSDVNVMLTYDAFDQQYKDFVVASVQYPDGKRTTEYKYSLVSGSNQYTYTSSTELPAVIAGSVVNMKMNNNNISSFNKVKSPEGEGTYVQAIDNKRIKMNDQIYLFNTGVLVYIRDYSGNLTLKDIDDIKVGQNSAYGNVKIYCNRPLNNGGKVEAIIIGYN